jgi:hypothetical protein
VCFLKVKIVKKVSFVIHISLSLKNCYMLIYKNLLFNDFFYEKKPTNSLMGTSPENLGDYFLPKTSSRRLRLYLSLLSLDINPNLNLIFLIPIHL